MKKKMRMMTCLLLVVLMVASLAVPTLATEPTVATASGSGAWNGHTFNWWVESEETAGAAGISLPNKPNNVTVYVVNNLYNEDNDRFGTSQGELTGYASVSARANNRFMTTEGLYLRGVVEFTYGKFYIGSTLVADNTCVREPMGSIN